MIYTVKFALRPKLDGRNWRLSSAASSSQATKTRRALALRMKPILEERARAQQVRKPGAFVRQKSDEQKPSRTDEAVSELANVSRDTIRNLNDYQRGVLALRMKPILEERARAQQGERTDIRPKSDESRPIRTDLRACWCRAHAVLNGEFSGGGCLWINLIPKLRILISASAVSVRRLLRLAYASRASSARCSISCLA